MLQHDELNRVLTVESIMTPYDELLTWEKGTDRERVLQEAKNRGFDLIPVAEQGHVDGVIHLGSHPEMITQQWLVSRDTSISGLLQILANSQKPGLLVLHGQEVIGLVTRADLNKLAVRVYVYNLIAALEMALAALVRNCFENRETDLRQTLSKTRLGKIAEEENRQKKADVYIDLVGSLYFPDLIVLVKKRPELRGALGLSGNGAERMFSGLVDLRNDVAHPASLLQGKSPNCLPKLNDRVNRTQRALQLVQRAVQKPDGQIEAKK